MIDSRAIGATAVSAKRDVGWARIAEQAPSVQAPSVQAPSVQAPSVRRPRASRSRVLASVGSHSTGGVRSTR